MTGMLRQLAGEMWREAAESGRSERTLSGGLRVVCKVEGGTRKLGLCRPGGRVPYDERVIATAAYGVPRAIWPEEIGMGDSVWSCYTWDYVAEQTSFLTD